MKTILPKNGFFLWAPVVIYYGLICFVSSLANLPQVTVPIINIDKFYHFLEYALLGFFTSRALAWAKHQDGIRKGWFGVTLVLLAVLAALDEWHQYFVPGRDMSVWDWVADTLGVYFGFLFFWKFYYKKKLFV